MIWFSQISGQALRLYYGLLVLAVALGIAAVALADDLAFALLAGSVSVALAAYLWRIMATRQAFSDPMIGNGDEEDAMGVSRPTITARPADEVKTVERGRVESWDDETGWVF